MGKIIFCAGPSASNLSRSSREERVQNASEGRSGAKEEASAEGEVGVNLGGISALAHVELIADLLADGKEMAIEKRGLGGETKSASPVGLEESEDGAVATAQGAIGGAGRVDFVAAPLQGRSVDRTELSFEGMRMRGG